MKLDADALQRAIDAAERDMYGKSNALVAFVGTDGQAELRFVRRIGTGWKVGGVARRERNATGKHGWCAGAVVVGSW